MQMRDCRVAAAAVLICLIPAAGYALTPYSQDFELLVQSDPNALANDGWLVFGNVYEPDGTTYIRGYGPYPAPNHSAAFCQIVLGEGGVEQGLQQLVVFSDYENTDHALGDIIESNVYHEQPITSADVGQVWAFEFQAKRGNIEGASTAAAFIKTLDPDAGYALTNIITKDMTTIPTTWSGHGIAIEIDASLEGQLLQFGFLNRASNYEGSGIFYDNLIFYQTVTDVPAGDVLAGASLRQNYPNPFNPGTRIEFALDNPGLVDISVYDLAGRRIATLQHGELGAGEHHVFWDGRTDAGLAAPAGQYRYVLKTAAGATSRAMVLLK
jgi:hypothetical protein